MPFKSNGSLNGGGDVTPTTVTALNNRAEIDTKRQGRFAIGARVKSFAPDGNRVKLEVEDRTRTRTRTNTNPNDTEANAAGRSGNARALRKTSKY